MWCSFPVPATMWFGLISSGMVSLPLSACCQIDSAFFALPKVWKGLHPGQSSGVSVDFSGQFCNPGLVGGLFAFARSETMPAMISFRGTVLRAGIPKAIHGRFSCDLDLMTKSIYFTGADSSTAYEKPIRRLYTSAGKKIKRSRGSRNLVYLLREKIW